MDIKNKTKYFMSLCFLFDNIIILNIRSFCRTKRYILIGFIDIMPSCYFWTFIIT